MNFTNSTELFRTVVNIKPSDFKIDYHSKILFVGSCFTENIGNRLAELKFRADVNPFGIIYNPISVKNSLDILIERKRFTKEDIHFHNELYFSYYHHSDFSDPKAEKCLEKMNVRIEYSSEFLRETDFLFLTFGTSWIYSLNSTKEIVSNCHKQPANYFTKHLLSVENIVNLYIELIEKLLQINGKLKIIFTVSPIRHWKDGAEGNQLSKSILLIAINLLKEKFNCVHYFPAYEIMMDELRDYRFYADDMIHPNQTAINYIRNRFTETYIQPEAQQLMNKVDKIVLAQNHIPYFPESENHKKFVASTENKIKALREKYPFIEGL